MLPKPLEKQGKLRDSTDKEWEESATRARQHPRQSDQSHQLVLG